MPPGMSLPSYSGAVGDLGMALSDQVKNETDEERKKRMAQMAMTKTMSPAAISLLGGYGGSA